VSFWSKAFRFTAVFLVLFASVEIFACDFLPSSSCYISSNSHSQGHQQDQDNDSGSGDNCLCCCAHMVPVQPLVWVPYTTAVYPAPEQSVEKPILSPSSIEHPPQLS
jgi:hypothetical protein